MGEAGAVRLGDVIGALRPRHWIKNVFVVAALFFAERLVDLQALSRVGAAFVVFCLLSSAVYLMNDIADREVDRQHPTKRKRAIASGRLGVRTAALLAALLTLLALSIALLLGLFFTAAAGAYLLLNVAYSLGLKRVAILDVMIIASGFLLRAWSGALVIDVEMSHWLVLCTGLVALFLGFVKRRQEIVALGRGGEQRPSLREYSLPFLDQMIAVVTASTILAYSLYAFSDEVALRLGTRRMGLTIPFVLFGIFRYLYLVHQRGEGDNPTEVLLSDKPLLATILLWAAMVFVAVYAL